MSTIVYSAQESDFVPGFVYRNPRYFSKPLGKPAEIIVMGNWPKVREAYEAQGCRVTVLAPGTPLRHAGEIAPPLPPVSPEGDLAAARAEYTAATGKKYYHGWDYDELMRRIREAGEQ